MGKQIFILFLLTLSILIGQFGFIHSSSADESHVGDIRYSILSEAQFRRLHGAEWEILRGQPVPHDSELREYWGDRNLPDARGVFLRSANNGRRRSEGNPEGHLPIGSYRGDTFKSHNHNDRGHDHGHNFHIGTTHGIGGAGAARGGGHGWLTEGVRGSVQQGYAHIQHTGDVETRPRNVTVNTFIKVRESTPRIHEIEISAEFVTRLFQSAEFLRAVRELVTATINRHFD